MSYKFISPKNERDNMLPQSDNKVIKFYQICQYPNKEGTHDVRKLIVSGEGNLLKMQERKCKKKKMDKFIEKQPSYKWKLYPVNSIKVIGLPNEQDMMEAQSFLLNSGNSFGGYGTYDGNHDHWKF